MRRSTRESAGQRHSRGGRCSTVITRMAKIDTFTIQLQRRPIAVALSIAMALVCGLGLLAPRFAPAQPLSRHALTQLLYRPRVRTVHGSASRRIKGGRCAALHRRGSRSRARGHARGSDCASARKPAKPTRRVSDHGGASGAAVPFETPLTLPQFTAASTPSAAPSSTALRRSGSATSGEREPRQPEQLTGEEAPTSSEEELSAYGEEEPPPPGEEEPTPTEEEPTPGGAIGQSGESGEVVTDPIDSRYLTEVGFGKRSFWIQPWRAYLDTWPASRLLDSLGINFNVAPAQAEATAQLLQDSGFKLARREIGWGALSYEDPSEFADESRIDTVLEALHNHGLRPLILLNANSGAPDPARQIRLETVASVPQGAQSVTLTPTSAALVVPGKTGFDRLSFGGDPDVLIASLTGDVATLSRPLPVALPAGSHNATTLLYAPFTNPILPSGAPNPAFQETLAGWLRYIATVCRKATSIFGPDGYDLEVWNELGFGSQFLNSEHYFVPSEAGTPPVTKAVVKALLDETVAYVRDPANGIGPGVGLTDGFASQTPFPSGERMPLGLTALSKHPYAGVKVFPAAYKEKQILPVNALGERDAAAKSFTPFFIPSYQSLLPEYTLTGTSTETLIRDLAPFTNYIYGEPHGRGIGPPGGTPPQRWITEYNLGTGTATPVGPDESTPEPVALTAADKAHFEAKTVLRSLVAMIDKGIGREYFFAAAPGALSLIGEGFHAALQANPSVYPGDALGGETTSALHNLLAQFQGPGPEGAARQLQLLAIAQDGNHAQFAGDGTAAHPALYDRDVLAVLPFQTAPTQFAIPVYVMTRDLLTLYEPNAPASDVKRYDLPDETFRITLGNLPETAGPPTIAVHDPITNEETPARLLSYQGGTATVEIAATDYPRTLTLDFSSP